MPCRPLLPLSASPSLSASHSINTYKHTHKHTCLELEVKESTFQMPGLLGHGDEHTLAGHRPHPEPMATPGL